MNNLPSLVHVNEDVLFQELEQEGVLLDLKSGTYFGLDRVGTRVWRLLVTRTPLPEVVTAIVDDFDVTEDQCASDILALVHSMEQQGLVTLA